MATGKVKWFNNTKGYGFITTEDGQDAFLHYSDMAGDGFKSLAEGDLVQFDLLQGPKGSKAVNVQKVYSDCQ
jgi:CspA family cold shock protein